MDFLLEFLMFLLQVGIIVVGVVIIVSAIGSIIVRKATHRDSIGHLEVRYLNDFFENMQATIGGASLPPKAARKHQRLEKQKQRKAKKASRRSQKKEEGDSSEHKESAMISAEDEPDSDDTQPEIKDDSDTKTTRRNVFVLTFKGDLEASRVNSLRHEISAVLTRAQADDEVLVRVNSAGGVVHGYGHAASQLLRIRNAGIRLIVAVDEVAASGGYMMAVVANKILAAPFAVVGSIGVAAEIPNFNRLLQKHEVDYEVLTAGKYKRTMSVFGENTDEAREKFLADMGEVHTQFQEFVKEHRADVDLDVVATGEIWYGERAKGVHLIDEIQTSDEYIMNSSKAADVYELTWQQPKKQLNDILSEATSSLSIIKRWLTGRIR